LAQPRRCAAPAEAIAARENTGGFIQDKDKLSQEV
jgi:hypothetical protein